MDNVELKVFVGYDPRYPDSHAVTVRSIKKYAPDVKIIPLLLSHLRGLGDYARPTKKENGQLFDVISDAPMSTEFAISRFLVPYLSKFEGYALFVDGDFMFRDDVKKIMEHADPEIAVSVVKHQYEDDHATKMDGQIQTKYERKNWSSAMLFNCSHPSLTYLLPQNMNVLPGRDLHALRWLPESQVGELPVEWNWLEGHSDPKVNPKAVHFTRGTPEMGVEPDTYADEWNAIRAKII